MSGTDHALWWTGMAVHLWQTALFLVPLALVARCMREAPARLLSALYWIGVAKLLLPLPLLGALSRSLLDRTNAGLATAGDAVEPVLVPVNVLMYPRILDPATSAPVGPSGWVWFGLTLMWSLGSCGLLLLSIRSILVARRSRPQRTDDIGGTTRRKLLAALPESGLKARDVRLDLDARAPFVCGVLRPVVVVPAVLIEELDRAELSAVLIHEAAHVRRRDPMLYGILAIVRAFFFFFPPIWWLAHRIRETSELACDEAVLRAGLPPEAYRRALARALSLGIAPETAASPVGILGHRVSFLRYRLERLRSARRLEAMLSHRLTVAGVAVLALGLSFLPLPPSTALEAATDAVSPDEDLNRLQDGEMPISITFNKAPMADVLKALDQATGIVIEGEAPDRSISLKLENVPIVESLRIVGAMGGVLYEVIGPRHLRVRTVMIPGRDGVTNPRLIPESQAQPEYPGSAREERLEGHVVLQVVIHRTGAIDDIRVLRVEPDDYDPFEEAAIEAVRQWRYEPATKDGEPVDVAITVFVEFKLDPGEAQLIGDLEAG